MASLLNNNIITGLISAGFNRTSASMSKSLENFSSGTKLHCANDDAINTVISKNVKNFTNITKNTLDNIQTISSALNITENSMEDINGIISRIYSLALDGSNKIQDKDSMVAIINEIIDRLQEIDRLAKNTNFRGKNLLDGSIKSFPIQVNGENGEDFTLEMKDGFTDCTTKALDIELPDNLNPEHEDFDPSNENFRAYMDKLSNALSNILVSRGHLGAYENRMDSIYNLMQLKDFILEERNSDIADTNVAEEASNYISNQILGQVQISLLSSTNEMQNRMLQLLAN